MRKWTDLDPVERRQSAKPLAFTRFDALGVEAHKTWVLKNVLALGATSSWIGGPGKGKSALLTDMGVHVAAGAIGGDFGHRDSSPSSIWP
jgi:hypothetical protein